MKKFLVSSILVTILTVASVFVPEITFNSSTANSTVASAAVANPIKSATPKVKVTKKTTTTVTLKTSNVSKTTGYQIYRATTKKGTYKYIGKTTKGVYVNKGLASNKSYYYKARAYKVINGKKYYSKYSSPVTVKTLARTNKTTTKPAATPTPTTKASSKDTNTYDSSFASQVLKIVNKERAKAGLSALTMSKELTAPANKRAQEIKQSFSHTRPNGKAWSTVLSEYNVNVQAAGENIAYNYNTPEKVMDAWMNSDGHRANILSSKFNHIGIGVYEVNGTVYCTQLFSN